MRAAAIRAVAPRAATRDLPRGRSGSDVALRTARLAAIMMIVVVFLLSACSVEQTLAPPKCSGGPTSALITAQSVPSARLLPCFDELPAGWEIESVDVNQSGSTIRIDSDRAGDSAAALRFVASCDVGSAIATPTDYERSARFELIHEIAPRFQADRYYVFDGGCIWWHFDFDTGVPSAMSVELGNSLQLLDRTAVNDDLRVNFIDEDL